MRKSCIIDKPENKVEKANSSLKEASKVIESNTEFLNTTENRKTHSVEINQKNSFETINVAQTADKNISEAMLWHLRLGHASKQYLLALAKDNGKVMNFNEISKDTTIQNCKACLQANSVRLSFNKIRARASKPLQIIHADTMGPISPLSHPNKFKFVLVLIDDATRAALAFPMRSKTEVPEHLESFIRSMRNLIGSNEKFCYLRCDRGTEFVCQTVKDVLDKYGADWQLACPDTPQHNGVAERFNRTLENLVRVMMLDSGLPHSYWDLAVKTAVYTYNRTPHKSTDMKSPLSRILPNQSECVSQVKRFGCAAYIKIARNTETKFSPQAKLGFLVGYMSTGYTILVPKEGKLYDSKHVRFLEGLMYKDFPSERIDIDESEITFESEMKTDESDNLAAEPLETVVGKDAVVPNVKRKRGRPKKNPEALFFLSENSDTE